MDRYGSEKSILSYGRQTEVDPGVSTGRCGNC
jgi:hypothetical protein